MDAWYTDVDLVIERNERYVDATFWGGEAFPVIFPVAINLVAITSAYLGCPYHADHSSHSGWAEPIIDDWSLRDPIKFNPHNEWWQLSKTLLDAAAQRAEGRYYVGMPDLNAPGELVALMRDTQRFLFDFMDDPSPIKPAIDEATGAWWRYWQAANGVVHQWIDGYLYWMGIWSDSPSADLQCDFNVMISPQMFDDYFLPGLGAADPLDRTHPLPSGRSRGHPPSRFAALAAAARRHPVGPRRRQAAHEPMAAAAAPHPGPRTPGRGPLRAVGGGDSGQ